MGLELFPEFCIGEHCLVRTAALDNIDGKIGRITQPLCHHTLRFRDGTTHTVRAYTIEIAGREHLVLPHMLQPNAPRMVTSWRTCPWQPRHLRKHT
jgi:hypothetical protein